MIFYSIDFKKGQEKMRPKLFASGSVELIISEIGTLVNLVYYGLLAQNTEAAEHFQELISWLISVENPAIWERLAEQYPFEGILFAVPEPKGGEDDG